MQNESRIARQNVVNFVLNIVIVVLCVVTVICGFWAVNNLVDDYSWSYDESSFYYHIESNNFYSTVCMRHRNEAEGVRANSTMKEYYGVAKYFEAASYYKAFLESGDTVRAEREKAKMEEAVLEMGGWAFLEEDIIKQLELE